MCNFVHSPKRRCSCLWETQLSIFPVEHVVWAVQTKTSNWKTAYALIYVHQCIQVECGHIFRFRNSGYFRFTSSSSLCWRAKRRGHLGTFGGRFSWIDVLTTSIGFSDVKKNPYFWARATAQLALQVRPCRRWEREENEVFHTALTKAGIRSGCCNPSYWEAGFWGCYKGWRPPMGVFSVI